MILIGKKQLFFIFLFAFPFLSSAQDPMKKLAIGISGGFNQSLIDFGRAVRTDYVDGISGGIQFQFMSRAMLGFETGIFYSQLGWEEQDISTRVPTGRINTQVIEFPLYSHLAFGKGRLRLLVDAGPYFRFLINETIDGVLTRGKGPDNETSYGLSFRGGLGWRSNGFIVQLRGNYHLGLTNFYEVTVATDISVERSLGGSLSVLIPFGNKYIDE